MSFKSLCIISVTNSDNLILGTQPSFSLALVATPKDPVPHVIRTDLIL